MRTCGIPTTDRESAKTTVATIHPEPTGLGTSSQDRNQERNFFVKILKKVKDFDEIPLNDDEDNFSQASTETMKPFVRPPQGNTLI